MQYYDRITSLVIGDGCFKMTMHGKSTADLVNRSRKILKAEHEHKLIIIQVNEV